MEDLIQNLDNCNGTDPELTLEIINQINSYYLNLTDYSKIDQDLAFAFPKPSLPNDNVGGILQFLKSQITLKPHDKCKEQALQLISWIIKNSQIQKYILRQYAVRFKDIADLIWKNQNERSRIQNAALEVLINVIQEVGSHFQFYELEAAQLYYNLIVNSEKSCFQPTVRGHMLHLLGVLANVYSNDLMNTQEKYTQLFNHLVSKVREEVECTHRHMEANVLLGSVNGLDAFFVSFEAKLDADSANMVVLYRKIEQIIDPKCSILHNVEETSTTKLKRREFQRAGLQLVANHGQLFQKYLTQYYEQWFSDLLSWVKSNNLDDSRVGLKAMFKFLECISSFYRNVNVTVLGEVSFRKKVVEFFTSRFRFILDNTETHGREVTVAVKGYGLISQICQDEDFADDIIFSRIVKRVQGILGEMEAPTEGRDKFSKYGSVSLLPTYVEAIGHILFSMKISDEESLATFHNRILVIEELSVALVTHFPQLSDKYRRTASFSFNRVLTSLHSRHFKWCRPFLEKVVHEGLTHIIASPTKTDADNLSESHSISGNEVGFRKLNLKTVQSYVTFWIDLIQIQNADNESTKLVYDIIMQWMLETIAKLDLTLEFIDDELEGSVEDLDDIPVDPVYNTKAAMVRDFQLFINLVEFMEAFVLKTKADYFTKWINVYLEDAINSVESYPFVSGFYKIIAFVFEVMRKDNYFQNDDDDDQIKQLFTKCSHFVKSLLFKVDEFRDDLLLSVLNIWLSAPDEIIVPHFAQLEGTMKTILRTGRTCFSLAARGIEALDRWFQMEKIQTEDMETLFCALFPILKQYFTAVGQEEILQDIIKTKPSARVNKFKTSKTELNLRRFQQIQLERKNVTLRDLQMSILRLFGSYGHFLNLDSCGVDAQISMNVEEKFLKYSIPFQDIKPDIYLENLLPRVIELCSLASERQLRTSSCECLHSIILYFLGFSVHSTSSASHGELFIKLFSTMMTLGSDADRVVRQLFNPLALQVVHWFTRKDSQGYGDIVLQIISNGLAQTEEAPLRDFSAVCLSEFFSWSLKHSNNSKIKQVMKTLCAMGTHAAPKYRQGSVLAFNSIYREFRENDELVSTYTLQLFHSYVTSLGLPSNMGGEGILVKSTQQAIRHLERILLKKKDKFNTDIRGRNYPIELGGRCLINLVEWILIKSGQSITSVGREVCLKLVNALAPSIRGLGTVEEFLFAFEKKHGVTGIIQICESYPSEDFQEDPYSFFEHTFKALSSSAEMYESLSNGGYPVAKLLKHPESRFVHNCDQLLNSDIIYFTRNSTVLVYFIKIGQIMCSLRNSFSSTLLQSFIKISLNVSKEVRDNRGSVGKLLSILDNLWGGIEATVLELNPNFSFELKQFFNLATFNEVKDQQPTVLQIEQLLDSAKWLNNLTLGDHLINILNLEEKQVIVSQIWNYIHSNLFSQRSGKDGNTWVSKRISFRHEELLQKLLILAFGLGLRDNVVFAVFDSTPVLCMDTKTKAKLTKGEIFQQVLLPAFSYNEQLINFQFLQTQTKLEKVGLLIQSLLTCVKDSKDLRKRYGSQLVSSTLNIWQQLHLNCEPDVVARIISGLTSLDMKFCRNSTQLCRWWSGPLLMTNSNLTLKEKSEFIHFFALFGLSGNPEIVNECVDAVDILVKQSLKPTPLFNWTNEEHCIAKVFFKLMYVYEGIPENLKLLSTLVKFIAKSTILYEMQFVEDSDTTVQSDKTGEKLRENICGIEIRNKLRNIITDLSDDELKVKIAETIFNTITAKDDADCRIDLAAYKFCLTPVMGTMSDAAFKKFFRRNILSIIQQIETKPNSVISIPCWNLTTIAMSLIEMLALRSSSLFIIGNDLNECYCQQLNIATNSAHSSLSDAKLLLKKLLKISQGFRSTPTPAQRDLKLRAANFSFNAASFNATVALTKTAQLELKHFTGFVFCENEKSESDHIWSNLINTTSRYTFQLIMDPGLSEKKVVEEKTAQSKPNPISVENVFEHSNRAVVAESSLANDCSRFDFTTSVKVSTSPFYQKIFAGINPYKNKTKNAEFVAPPEMSLEWSAVNEHECMFSLIQAMKKMETFPSEEDWPAWTKALKYVLEKPGTHPNVKAFVIGAIINCDDVFKQYAVHFIDSILKAVLADTFPTSESDTTTTPSLNHFIKDIIIMLLGWSEIACPTKPIIKQILEYFIVRTEHARKDVFENNLQVLQAIIRHWVVPKFDVADSHELNLMPYHLIIQGLERTDPRIGLNLIKYFCLGGALPCELNNVADFVDHVSRSFSNTSKIVNGLAGEATGLLFKMLESMKFPHVDKALKRMKEKKLDRERSRVQSYFLILSNIGKYYPAFLVPFKNDILSYLKNALVRDQVLTILVDILKEEMQNETSENLRNELVQNLYVDLEGRGVFSIELKNDVTAGVELLHIVLTTDLGKREDKVQQLIGWTQQAEFLSGDSGNPIRARYASAISTIYQQFGGHKVDDNMISTKSEKMFIRLLFDENLDVQKVVQEFWASNLKSWSKSPSLLLELMEILGDNPNAIAVSLDLMIKRCASSPDFTKHIFDKDLAECTFNHYDINTSWRLQSTMHPLFAESLSSSQSLSLFPKAVQDSVLSQRNGTQLGMNLLRSTLRNLQFTQTQERQTHGKNYSQSQDGDSITPMELDDSFQFDAQESFVLPSVSNVPVKSSTSNPLDSLRRRFYERSESDIPFYARREIQRQQTIVDSEVEVLRKRRGGVKLSRTYRIGELPDIVIRNSELLAGISALAKKDELLGKTILVHLASSFVKDMNKNEGHIFVHNANITLDRLFTNYGPELSSQFAATLLEMSTIVKIPVKAHLVSNISRRFALERIGILKFESDLAGENNTSTDVVPTKRPRIAEETNGVERWLRMGELYKQLEDFDTVRNVFTHVRDSYNKNSEQNLHYEKAREALYFESLSKYLEAQERYDDLYQAESENNDTDSLLLQFFDDAMYKVMANLSDWNGRYARCHEFCINHSEELHTDSYRNRVLPNQVSSGVQVILRNLIVTDVGTENVINFKTFIQNLKGDEEEWKAVADRFPTDLSILNFIESDVGKSQSLLESSWVAALNSFQSFENLSKKDKKECFLELQKSSILYDTLDWMRSSNYSVADIDDKTLSIVEKWRRSTTSSTMPLLNADLIVAQRSAFLSVIRNKLEQLMVEDKDELIDDITRLQFEQNLWVVNLASLDGNADVGNCYLNRAKIVAEGCDEEEFLKWRNSLCQLLTSCESSYTMKDWTRQWSSAWKKLAELQEQEQDDCSELCNVQSDLLRSLINKVSKDKDTISRKCIDTFCEAFTIAEPNRDYNYLINAALDNSLRLIGKATGNDESSQDFVSTSSEVAMKSYHLIKSILQKFPEKYSKSEQLHEKLLLCMVCGMRDGDKTAIQLFPSSFAILEEFPNLIDKLSVQILQVPSWIFLPWLDQLVTNYRHKAILKPFLKPIIERILVEYPQAFQLQYSDLDLIKSSTLPPALIYYRKALKALVLPNILFKNIIYTFKSSNSSAEQLKTDIRVLLQEFKDIQENPEFYGNIHQEYVQELYPKLKEKYQMLVSSSQNESGQGSCDSNIILQVRQELTVILNPQNSSTLKKNIFSTLHGRSEMKPFVNLADLSPWLAKYHFSNFKDGIEIPALYTKFSKPDANFHPNIVSFHSTVKIYDSITKPIGLTLVANNGQKFHFLMKCGDDLRQDKRIQQLFSLFNQVFTADSRCRQRDLSIMTYSVIPISKDFGMIELVQKTESVKKFTLNTLKHQDNHHKCAIRFGNAISNLTGVDRMKKPLQIYGELAGKGRNEVETLFDKTLNALPKNLFRDNVKRSAESLHSYFILREKLTRSYATMCIVHYLLGIGDRHLDNNMLKLNTGQFMGIDFGHAFGSAIVGLPVPELVPFRLTPQLQNFMAPYGPSGIFKETMMHTWRAILKSSELVSLVVEIFVAEPTVDWSREIKKAQDSMEFSATTTEEVNGLPVQVLREKLNRTNPLEIVGKLLQINDCLRPHKKYLENWKKVLLDGREETSKMHTLNDEQLIDTLISLASDKNVLGRTWSGWGAWV